jgi:hypothetical protein
MTGGGEWVMTSKRLDCVCDWRGVGMEWNEGVWWSG